MEQNVRDARIATLYEATTGVQSMDLLGRKVLIDGGQTFAAFLAIIRESYPEIDNDFLPALEMQIDQWEALTHAIMSNAADNIDELGASSFDYLMYAGYTVLAWFWARMASVAKANTKQSDTAFYRSKVETADFYFKKILPRSQALKIQIENGSAVVMASSIDDFKDLIAL